MTETPVHVRAVARVGSYQPEQTGAAALLPRRRPGHIGPVHVLQLVLVEVTIVAILAALNQGIAVLAPAALIGLVLMVATLGRTRGRWWLERRVLRWQFQRRRHAQPAHRPADPRLAALQWLAPGLTVTDVAAPDGSQIGVARDDAGWYAVAALPTSAAMRDEARSPLPLDTLVSALSEADHSGGAVVQVLTHTVPAAARDGAAGQSYRELLQRYGPVAVPVDRVTWIAVRLDARSLAEVGAGLAEQAPTTLAALLRHLIKALRRAGIAIRALDREGLLDALDRSCDLVPIDGGAPVAPREDWNMWHSGRLAHRSYWVQGWPSVAQAGALLDWLSTAPAALTSVAMMLAANGDDVDLRCLVRVAAAPDQLASVCEAVSQGARLAHAQLFELDGEQGPAVYATAPTGGGPR